VLAEERTQRLDGVEAESVVVQVDCVQVLALEQCREQGVECGRDFCQQAAGEDVGEVGVLEGGFGGENIGETLAGFNAESVAFEVHFFQGGAVEEGLDVRGQVFGGVEFESAAAQGEDLAVCHGGE
jgi:hypothetical protein